MTVHLPLNAASPLPPSPSFLVPAKDHAAYLARAFHAIMKARRIVVICGAGISVQAGIPDFRSADGLFQSIKRDNPKEAMSSGKELFDVSVFNSEQKTSLFCQMIAQLSDLSQAAEPTSFHQVLRELDDRGRLLRVYTQNIDAIEQKSGLSFGVPEYEGKRGKAARAKAKLKAAAAAAALAATEESATTPANPDQQQPESSSDPVPSTSRLPSPPAETPRCIPLHGTLQSMHCQICNHSSPLLDYLPSLASGVPPPCPECTSLEATRQLVGKRPRGIGRLRPSVVLYNEMHKDGEGVGDIVQKDLMGASKGKGRSGADLLLVVGTSLRVPGTKRMVREFAKAVRSRGAGSSSTTTKDEQQQQVPTTPSHGGRTTANSNRTSSGLATPAPSPRRSPTADDESASGSSTSNAAPMKAIYLNLDFPVPTREWEGVFDAWIQGDAQDFAEMLKVEIEKEAKAKEVLVEKKMKKKREEEIEVQAEEKEKEKGEVAEAMLDLASKGKDNYALREEEEEEEEEDGPAEDELPDYGRMMLQREKEKKAKAKVKEILKKQQQQPYEITSVKRKLGQVSKNPSSSSSSSLSSLSSLSSSAESLPSLSSSSITPPTPTSLGKRRKASLPLSPPSTPVVRRKVRGEAPLSTRTSKGKGKERSRNEDGNSDEDIKMDDRTTQQTTHTRSTSKLFVRIPPRIPTANVQYTGAVPENMNMHIKTNLKNSVPQPRYVYTPPQPPLQPYYRASYVPPLYVRPYEFLRGDRMDVGAEEDMDVDVDVVGDERTQYDYEQPHTPARFSPLSRYAGGMSSHPHMPVQSHSHSPSRSRSGSMRDYDHARDKEILNMSPPTSPSRYRHSISSSSYSRSPSLSSAPSSPTSIRLPPRPRAVPPSPPSIHHSYDQYHPPSPSHYTSQTSGAGMETAVSLPTPPRLNDHHRLGGRIDHSHTLLSLRMARTQLAAQDAA